MRGFCNSLNNSLLASDNLKFQFATDGEGNYGYLGADDRFIPFKNGILVESVPVTLSDPSSSAWYQKVVMNLSSYNVSSISNIAFTKINTTDCNILVRSQFTFTYSDNTLTINFDKSIVQNGFAYGTTASLIII